MKKVDLSSLNLEQYYLSIDIEKIKNKLSDAKFSIVTDKLEEIIKTKDLVLYIHLCDTFTDIERKEIEKAFDYTAHRKKANFMKYFKKLGIKSCPFCNNNYIYFYQQGGKKFNTLATLEHYYPKAQYPHLSLTFYNLIPCCSACNSKFKGSKDHVGKIAHPYYDDFDDLAEFSVNINSIGIKKDVELNVNLKSVDEKCKATIDRFNLDKIYKQHSDIAKEIWNKAQVYTESQIEELYESFYRKLGYTKDEVKNMIFCNYLNNEDMNKRNHAKLTQDVLKQFELIKGTYEVI